MLKLTDPRGGLGLAEWVVWAIIGLIVVLGLGMIVFASIYGSPEIKRRDAIDKIIQESE